MVNGRLGLRRLRASHHEVLSCYRMGSVYLAFIAYARSRDAYYAARIRIDLARIIEPWVADPLEKLFVAETGMGLTENIPKTLEQRLQLAEHLIVLASPESAASTWVQEDEISVWLRLPDKPSPLLVLTAGNITVSRAGIDETQSDALPPALRGRYPEPPKIADLRAYRTRWARMRWRTSYREQLAQIAAPLLERRGIRKEQILDEARSQASARRRRAIGVAACVGAAVLVVVGWQVRKRSMAERGAALSDRAAASKSCLEQSARLATSQPMKALAWAIEGARRRGSPEANEALVHALNRAGKLPSITAHVLPVTEVRFDAVGTTMLTSSEDGTVGVWDTTTWTRRGLLRDFGQRIVCVEASPDARHACAVTEAGELQLWDVPRTELLQRFPVPHGSSDPNPRFLDDGKALGIRFPGGQRRVWDTESGLERDPLVDDPSNEPQTRVRSSSWSAQIDAAGNVIVEGVGSSVLAATLSVPDERVIKLAADPLGHILIAITNRARPAVWRGGKWGEPCDIGCPGQPITAALFSRDGRWLLLLPPATPKDSSVVPFGIMVWSAAALEPWMTIRSDEILPERACVDPGGQHIVAPTRRGGLVLWPLDALEAAVAARPPRLEPWDFESARIAETP